MSSHLQCKFPSFIQNFTVCNRVWSILVRWVGVLVGIQNCVYIMVASFPKPKTGICISLLGSQVVDAVVGVSCGRMPCAA